MPLLIHCIVFNGTTSLFMCMPCDFSLLRIEHLDLVIW